LGSQVLGLHGRIATSLIPVADDVNRLSGDKGIYLRQQLKDKLIEHKQYIDKYGEDLPDIRNWKWGNPR
jgi:xylulose-5-phosphate/fructose-6-phosphate phosphoketolase